VKAVVCTGFGPPEVLRLADLDRPAPRRGEVLIRVRATTVTAAEAQMRRGRPLWGRLIIGFRRPRKRFRVLGTELSGDVVAVGAGVSRFAVGDEVFGFTGFSIGAYAEYKCLPQTGSLAHKPRSVTHEEAAAAVDGATTALFFLRDKASIQPGQNVLIIGASGSIGTYAVQLAKHFGARVTGVCSTRNVDLVTSLGADSVIDYTRTDFTRGGERYDIIFDTVGKSSYGRCRRSLTERGRYVSTVGLDNAVLALVTPVTGGRRVVTGMSVRKDKALPFLRDLIEAGQLRIVIDRRYALADIVEAHRYVDTGHKRGNVAVSVAAPAAP
jgi:NADPH2:quinone reductase